MKHPKTGLWFSSPSGEPCSVKATCLLKQRLEGEPAGSGDPLARHTSDPTGKWPPRVRNQHISCSVFKVLSPRTPGTYIVLQSATNAAETVTQGSRPGAQGPRAWVSSHHWEESGKNVMFGYHPDSSRRL